MFTRSAPVLMRSAPILVAAALAQLSLFVLAVGLIDVLLLIPVVVASSAFGVFVLVRWKSGFSQRPSVYAGASQGQQPRFASSDMRVPRDRSGLVPTLLNSLTSSFTGFSQVFPVQALVALPIGSNISRLQPVNTEAAKLADPNRATRRRDVVDQGSANKGPFRVLMQSVSSPRAALTYPVMRRFSCQ